MTLLPFEEPHLTNTGFDAFWKMALRKVGKGAARDAYRKAIIRAGEAVIHGAWEKANDEWRRSGTEICFVPHPSTWLNQDRWEDEPHSKSRSRGYDYDALKIIAAHVRKPWCERGAYSRDVLEQCVAAEVLTQDEAEAVL